MKKYLSMLIALMMVAGLMANPAISCAEEDTSDIVKYSEGITEGSISFDKSTGTITDCDESVTGSITIPSEKVLLLVLVKI